jgi:hypothetical protein
MSLLLIEHRQVIFPCVGQMNNGADFLQHGIGVEVLLAQCIGEMDVGG